MCILKLLFSGSEHSTGYLTTGQTQVSSYVPKKTWLIQMMKQILTFVVSTYGARHPWGPNFLRCLNLNFAQNTFCNKTFS